MAITLEGRQLLDQLRRDAGLDSSLPWGGRSPRVLTRGHNLFSLRREAAPLDEDGRLDEQYRRFLQQEEES